MLGLQTDDPTNLRRRSQENAQAMVEDIAGRIANGEIRIGEQLPNERALCRQYGVSRHTVRRAMNTLEQRGVIGRYVGRGSFVLEPVAAASESVPNEPGWSLLELTEARLLFEPALAALMVERAEPKDFDEAERCLGEIERSDNWLAFKESNYAFRLCLVRSAGNSFLTHVFELVIDCRRRNAWARKPAITDGFDLAKAACLAESWTVLVALRRRDVAGVRTGLEKALMRIMVSISMD